MFKTNKQTKNKEKKNANSCMPLFFQEISVDTDIKDTFAYVKILQREKGNYSIHEIIIHVSGK